MRCFAAFLLLYAGLAHATPVGSPTLRLEPGVHTGPIGDMAVDPAGRVLVTAAYDMTVRAWDPATGELRSVMRVPLRSGNGMLLTVAISPDGARVAAAGGDPEDGATRHSVWIFDVASGALLARHRGFPTEIASLAWSPDGTALVAGLNGREGLRVLRAADGAVLDAATDFEGATLRLDVHAGGRVAALSLVVGPDGALSGSMLRTYALRGGRLVPGRRVATGDGNEVASLAFAPDGASVAVGGRGCVRVFGWADGPPRPLREDCPWGADRSRLVAAWDASGGTLYAGGDRAGPGGAYAVSAWRPGAPREARETPAAAARITGLLALPGGGVAFRAAGPAWGVIDRSGVRRVFVPPAAQPGHAGANSLRVSADGASFELALAGAGTAVRAGFELDARRVGEPLVPLQAARLDAPSLRFDEFFAGDSTQPARVSANGRTVRFPYDRLTARAVTADGATAVIGTNGQLRRVDRQLEKVWSVTTPAGVLAVNLSADARLVIAALADGSVRWYRLRDGRELLAWFRHVDGRAWIAWTPGGHYDASPGGERLAGWHVDRADDSTDFYPLQRFRERYFRPDVIGRVLATADEARALRLADAAANARRGGGDSILAVLPPSVQAQPVAATLPAGATHAELVVSARTASDAPVTALRVRVGGQAVAPEPARGTTLPGSGPFRLRVPVPPGTSEVHVFAVNRHGVGEPARVRIARAGAPSARAPRLFLLAVGVGDYADGGIEDLPLAPKDSADFVAVMERQRGALYSEVVIRRLADAEATRAAILEGLAWLRAQVAPGDLAVLYLAGHGVNDDDGRYLFAPVDARFDLTGSIGASGVSSVEIRDALESLRGRAVAFIDTCHAANAVRDPRRRGAAFDRLVNEMSAPETGVVVFAAGTGDQLSVEHPAWGNGAFTKAVVEGLRGRADTARRGQVTHRQLDGYVTMRVTELAASVRHRLTPVTLFPAGVVPDFPLVAVAPP